MHDEIVDVLRRAEWAKGLDMARAAVKADPKDPQAYRLLALALAMTGGRVEAHAALDRAIELAPDDASLRYQRATLLVAGNRSGEALAELEQTTGIDPNELRAYVLQGQLALAQGDLDEADRLARLAARIDPDHPWLLTVQGMVLLHRQQFQQAHALLSRAAKLAPGDLQTMYALGLSFQAQGHLAFAEQAFRGVVDMNPAAHSIRHMLADVIRRQGRYAEAAEIIESGMPVDDAMPPDLLRYAGELWLMAGNTSRALPLLRRATAASPDDRITLDALIEALRRQGDAADARQTLEVAIAAAPHIDGLWSARLSFESEEGDAAAIADRWQAAIPDSVHPLHLHMWLAAQKGDTQAARDLAKRIIEREPGHFEAQAQMIEYLFQNDPDAAVAHIESLLPNIQDPATIRMVLGWLGRAQDRAGLYAAAVGTWERLDAIPDPQSAQLPVHNGHALDYPPQGTQPFDTQGPMFVYGPPGSGIERVVGVLLRNLPERVRLDRSESSPPHDRFQFPGTAHRLAAGDADGASVIETWRAALPARGVGEADIIDWLLWWDNALLQAFRQSLPEARLLLVLADPRDMLLDWLQRGTYIRYAIESPATIAAWMAQTLGQIATLIEHNPMPHVVLRVDEFVDDAGALASKLGDALQLELQPIEGLGPGRFPAGHWRLYREVLAEPFAQLTPVARRLGYPEA